VTPPVNVDDVRCDRHAAEVFQVRCAACDALRAEAAALRPKPAPVAPRPAAPATPAVEDVCPRHPNGDTGEPCSRCAAIRRRKADTLDACPVHGHLLRSREPCSMCARIRRNRQQHPHGEANRG
jgi:hypothetical protein